MSEKRQERERPRVRVTDKRHSRTAEPEPGAPERGAPAPASDPPVPAAEAEPERAQESDDAQAERDELAEARAQAAEYLDHLRRLQAEFDNYRKRTVKEQTRALDFASEGLVRRLLEVVDDFQLAVMAADAKPDFERFLHGVELVYAKLLDVLKAEGLEPIEAEGKPFDPEQHEALMSADDGEGDPVVVDVLRPGYRYRGRVIRPAGVKVGRR